MTKLDKDIKATRECAEHWEWIGCKKVLAGLLAQKPKPRKAKK